MHPVFHRHSLFQDGSFNTIGDDLGRAGTIDDVVRRHPDTLTSLTMVRWFHEYTKPVDHLPFYERGLKDHEEGLSWDGYRDLNTAIPRLVALYGASMKALHRLAPVLRRNRPKVKKGGGLGA